MLRNLYNSIRERLGKRYRVELIDDVTLSSARQFYIKPITLILWSGLLILGIVLGTATVVILTPAFQKLMPNTITLENHNQEIETWQVRYDSISNDYNKLNIYLSTFRYTLGVEGDSIQLIPSSELDSLLQNDLIQDVENGTEAVNYLTENNVQEAGQVEETETLTEPVPTADLDISIPKGPPAVKLFERPVLLNLFPPLKGRIRNPYNETRKHYGVDIVAEENSPIHSVAEGYVLISEYSDRNGWVIGVLSSDDVMAFYKHNSKLLKEAGEYVKAGEPLAIIGNTGENSTGPHLHFELWKGGKPLNPIDYINFN